MSNNNLNRQSNTVKLAKMGMLVAISIVLVYFIHFPLIPAVPFLEYDPADIPIMMGTGGNAGSQASTLMIRGLALGEVELKDIPKILWREIRVGVMLGAVLGVVNFLRMLLLDGLDPMTAAVVAGSLFLTVIMAKSLGCTLPMLAKKIHLDPALMASPMITTLVDAGSLAIMFGLASRFLLG